MRKERYADLQKSLTPSQRRRGKVTQFLYFFLAWNAASFAIYGWVKKRKMEDDPEWDKLSLTQKYLSLMYDPEKDKDRQIVRVRLHGLSSYTKETTTMGELVRHPESKQTEDVEKEPATETKW